MPRRALHTWRVNNSPQHMLVTETQDAIMTKTSASPVQMMRPRQMRGLIQMRSPIQMGRTRSLPVTRPCTHYQHLSIPPSWLLMRRSMPSNGMF
eukprot:jgi/Chrzof1/14622/Cz09g09240.t1